VLAAALVGAAVLAYLLRPVLVPLFFAFIVAYVFDPVADYGEKIKIRRSVTIGALAAFFLILLLALPVYFLPAIITEADQLISVAQERLENPPDADEGGMLVSITDRLPLEDLVEALGWEPEAEEYDPLAVVAQNAAEKIRTGAVDFLREYGGQIAVASTRTGSGVMSIFGAIGRGVVNVVLAIGNIALFAFVAAYLLKDFDHIVATARDLIPPRFRSETTRIIGAIDRNLRGFLRGQAMVGLCLGIMYCIGFVIAGVPFGLLLGIIGGIANFIPYLGLILTIGPTVVLCLVQYGTIDWHLGVVIGTLVVAQTLEGSFITPKLVGDQVGLGPVWVILAVLVFGSWLGFLGLLLAVPIAATLKVLILEGIDRYRKSDFFKQIEDGGT
jgi:predicted PurR-regulated permease PerM